MATYSDDFNRSNGPLGSNWTVLLGSFSVVSNAASAGAANAVAAYNATVAAAQAAECAGAGTTGLGPAVRIQSDGQCLAAWLVYDYALDDGSYSLCVGRIAATGAVASYLRNGDGMGDGLAPTTSLRVEIDAAGAVTVKANGTGIYSGSFTALSGGQIGMRSNAAAAADNWTGGDLAAQGSQPATASWAGASAAASAGPWSAQSVIPLPVAAWVGAAAVATASMGAFVPVSASADWTGASASASASMAATLVTPPDDDFNRPDGLVVAPWAGMRTDGQPTLRIVGNAAGGQGSARWTGGTYSSSQWASVPLLGGSCAIHLRISNAAAGETQQYSCNFYEAGLSIQRGSTSLRTASASIALPSVVKFSARSTPSGTLLQAFVDDVLVADATDANPLPNGYPGLTVDNADPDYGTPLPCVDDWRAGSLPDPASAEWTGAAAVASAHLGLPVSASASWTGATATASALLGLPVPASAAWAGATASASGSASASVSRVKASTIAPEYAAWGGFDTYSSRQKGKLTEPGARTIGGRQQLGNGDRVFFKVAHDRLLTNDGGTVAKAELRFWVKRCQATDHRATGAAATPSGTMFDVRQVSGPLDLAAGDGMAATLGSVIGSIAARPIWKYGQPWFDGSAIGSPIREEAVDITAAYNAAIGAGDLLLCLECLLSDAGWVAELYGADPDFPELAPRVEVQRWGEVPIAIESDTCEPHVTVGALPAGATLSRVQWGYDPKVTAPGGGLKHSSRSQNILWGDGTPAATASAPPIPLGEGNPWRSEWGTDNPAGLVRPLSEFRIPMVQANSRVYLEIEIDYGDKGALLFKRSWATPFAPRPNLRAPPVPHYSDWLEVRGPFEGRRIRYTDTWAIWVKRTLAGWQADHDYAIGDVVASPLDNRAWCCVVPGRSGASCPLAAPSSIAANVYTSETVGAGTPAKWIRHNVYDLATVPGGTYWQMWVATDWENPDSEQPYYRWFPFNGGSGFRTDLGVRGQGSAAPLPSACPRYVYGQGTQWEGNAEYGPSLPFFDFDDISEVGGQDESFHPGFFLYSKRNPDGVRWDIGLVELFGTRHGAENWFAASECGGLGLRDHGILYTAESRPDLSKSVCVRAQDWRTQHFHGYSGYQEEALGANQPLLVAFTATGAPWGNPGGTVAERVIVLGRSDFFPAWGWLSWSGGASVDAGSQMNRHLLPRLRYDAGRGVDPWLSPLAELKGYHSRNREKCPLPYNQGRIFVSLTAPTSGMVAGDVWYVDDTGVTLSDPSRISVYENGAWVPFTNPNAGKSVAWKAWTKEADVAISGVASLTAHHCLTADRKLYTVIAARTASGNGWIGSRSEDYVRWAPLGTKPTREVGTWATATVPTWKRAWAALPAIPNPDLPDFATGALVLQDAAGLRILRPDTLAAQSPTDGAGLCPPTDWSTLTTYDRQKRIVRRLPMDGKLSQGAHGGGVVVAYEGSTLKVQSISDVCRVSEVTSYTLPQPILSVHVQSRGAWEGEPFPIVTRHADGFRTTLCVAQIDQGRLDLIGQDQRLQFTSGKLRSAVDEECELGASHFVADQPNIHHRGLVHLPGHNTFALTYKFDKDVVERSIATGDGLMNNCGWLLAHLKGEGIQGERVRLIVTQSPAFGGMWWDLNDDPDNPDRIWCPGSPLKGYNPEAVGGDQYPLLFAANWYYSTDYLTWRPLADVDYVLDGETHGGAYVLSLTLPADEVWISKEIVSDIRTYKTLLAKWKTKAPALVRATTANGELELPVSGGILSQTRTFPA